VQFSDGSFGVIGEGEVSARLKILNPSVGAGTTFRKSFGGAGLFDGVVTAQVPPETGDTEALWHVRYSDGDEEDLGHGELLGLLVRGRGRRTLIFKKKKIDSC
jgi:hypothetical protein